jgi:hypothetical protein
MEVNRAVSRRYHATPKGKAYDRKYAFTYQQKYPERIKAQNSVGTAIRNGKLAKQPCTVCGVRKVEAHHPDYSKPLKVVWLCRKHHRAVHKK